MFDAHTFFKQRFAAHMKETSRYLRYIFNGHIAVAMLFLFQRLLITIRDGSQNFPSTFRQRQLLGERLVCLSAIARFGHF